MPPLQTKFDSQYLYLSLPNLPVILGGLIVSWQNGMSLSVSLLGLLLLFCGTGCGWLLWQRHVKSLTQNNVHWKQDETSKINAVTCYTSELERLLLTISPILSQQVMVSREHTEQEIISLTNRFSVMVNELQQIVDSTDNAVGEPHFHLDSVLNTSRDFLQPVLTSIRYINDNQKHVVNGLQTLSGHVLELNEFAGEVRSLNEYLGQQLDEKLKTINAVVITASSNSDELAKTQELLLALAENNINQTLTHLELALNHYRDDVDALRNNAEQIRGEINNVLVALQFQDRVSQILTQVENNLLNLQQTIETIQQQGSQRDSNMLQVDAAVEHIENNYKSVKTRPEREPDGSDDLTFF